MRRIVVLVAVIFLLAVPIKAMEFSAPTAPESAQQLMPDDTENFGEGLLYIMRSVAITLLPSLTEATRTCISLIACALLVGILSNFSESGIKVISLIGTVSTGMILFRPVNALIKLGTETVLQISQYGRLLVPVMTAALAAQGAASKSSAIYLATTFFDALLSVAVSDLLVPLVYIYLCVSVVSNMFVQPLLSQIKKFIKWLMTWGLKIVLYVFTGYISITGVVGGTADATMLKAAKLTISGMVPVVGNILSDASEAVLVSAGLMKNAVGIYGLLVMIVLWIEPFIQIGTQYLMLKITCGICEMFGAKKISDLMKDFSITMGLVLAMTGTVCLIFLISTICFMKGVA